MNIRRKRQDIRQTFMEEEAKSEAFLKKLGTIKKKNKESKERTVLNQVKIEWYNKMKSYQKRERALEDELDKFMRDNANLKLGNDCEEATRRVRDRLHEHHDKIMKKEMSY
mgnify:CR=1 FL=1